ncbi:MAG: BspA family leucine-rich repeat surface protein [Lachnospiraceae bacterium]|jgi:hypothetical protein
MRKKKWAAGIIIAVAAIVSSMAAMIIFSVSTFAKYTKKTDSKQIQMNYAGYEKMQFEDREYAAVYREGMPQFFEIVCPKGGSGNFSYFISEISGESGEQPGQSGELTGIFSVCGANDCPEGMNSSSGYFLKADSSVLPGTYRVLITAKDEETGKADSAYCDIAIFGAQGGKFGLSFDEKSRRIKVLETLGVRLGGSGVIPSLVSVSGEEGRDFSDLFSLEESGGFYLRVEDYIPEGKYYPKLNFSYKDCSTSAIYEISVINFPDNEAVLYRDKLKVDENGKYSALFGEPQEIELSAPEGFSGDFKISSVNDINGNVSEKITCADGKLIVSGDIEPGKYSVEIRGLFDGSSLEDKLLNAPIEESAVMTVEIPYIVAYRDNDPADQATTDAESAAGCAENAEDSSDILFTVADSFNGNVSIPDEYCSADGLDKCAVKSSYDAVMTDVFGEYDAGPWEDHTDEGYVANGDYTIKNGSGKITISPRSAGNIAAARIPYYPGCKNRGWINAINGEPSGAEITVNKDYIFIPDWEPRSTLLLKGEYSSIGSGDGELNNYSNPMACSKNSYRISLSGYSLDTVLPGEESRNRSGLIAKTENGENEIVSGAVFSRIITNLENAEGEAHSFEFVVNNGIDLREKVLFDVSEAQDGGVVAFMEGDVCRICTSSADSRVMANTNMAWMFTGQPQAGNFSFEGLDTGECFNYRGMFAENKAIDSAACSGNASVNLSDLFKSDHDTSVQGMFFNSSVRCIDLSGSDLSAIVNMQKFAADCSLLESFCIGEMSDTGRVLDFYRMLSGCLNIRDINLKGIDTASARDMAGMFWQNTGSGILKMLDLRDFDTANVLNFTAMYAHQTSLETIVVSSKGNGFDTSSAVSGCGKNMFLNCVSLQGMSGTRISSACTVSESISDCLCNTHRARIDYSDGDYYEGYFTSDIWYDLIHGGGRKFTLRFRKDMSRVIAVNAHETEAGLEIEDNGIKISDQDEGALSEWTIVSANSDNNPAAVKVIVPGNSNYKFVQSSHINKYGGYYLELGDTEGTSTEWMPRFYKDDNKFFFTKASNMNWNWNMANNENGAESLLQLYNNPSETRGNDERVVLYAFSEGCDVPERLA